MSEYVLKIDDLTEQAKAFMEPFEYAKMLASFHYDDEGVLTQAQIVSSRQKKGDEAALKKHMDLVNKLHTEAPIFAVLGGLANGIDLTNDEYMIVSYICRKGIHGDSSEFTKYNPLVDGIMS
jgi:hypothetical protein